MSYHATTVQANYHLHHGRGTSVLTELEYELAKERSSALGHAGRQLQQAIVRYVHGEQQRFSATQQQQALQYIADRVYNLMLQREFLGLIDNNLHWICREYQVPQQALSLLGIPSTTKEEQADAA